MSEHLMKATSRIGNGAIHKMKETKHWKCEKKVKKKRNTRKTHTHKQTRTDFIHFSWVFTSCEFPFAASSLRKRHINLKAGTQEYKMPHSMVLNAYALERTTCAHEAHSFIYPNGELTWMNKDDEIAMAGAKMNETNEKNNRIAHPNRKLYGTDLVHIF